MFEVVISKNSNLCQGCEKLTNSPTNLGAKACRAVLKASYVVVETIEDSNKVNACHAIYGCPLGKRPDWTIVNLCLDNSLGIN
jgi:hypothetical protein